MWKNIKDYLFLSLGVAGIIYAIILFVEASQPCGSDGCLIHILYIIVIIILAFAIPMTYFSWRNIKRNK
jgi:hypothetical protein